MRTKCEILKHIDDFYEEVPDTGERQLVSLNMIVEVLADIRDQLPVLSTLLASLLVNTTQDH